MKQIGPQVDRGMARVELRLCHTLNRLSRRRGLQQFFQLAGYLGDGWLWYLLIIFLPFYSAQKGLRCALLMSLAGLVTLLLYRHLKSATRRSRPFTRSDAIIALSQPLDEGSFPSGHTLHATVFTLIAVAYFPELAPVLWPLTASIAASRVMLGLHYPSDVIAAALLGIGIANTALRSLPPP